MDTDLNYCPIYSNGIFEPVVMLLFIILCIREELQVSKPEVCGRLEIQNFLGASLPWSPPVLCLGPAVELTALPDP